jgi:heme/copper-type cytochrome/quinol oxidase subunit 2
MALKGLVGVIAVLSVVSIVLTAAAIGDLSAAEKEGATVIVAEDTEWDKDTLTASANSTTKIVVDNKDVVAHTFTVDELDLDVKVGPAAETLVELNSPRAGEYRFYCKVVGHEDMEGTLTVR